MDFDPRTLKKGQQVLWLHKGEVEVGDVLFLTDRGVDVIWLEGYKSRNDSPTFDEILSVYDKNGEQHELGAFSGKGWLTSAGKRYLAAKANLTPNAALTRGAQDGEEADHGPTSR